MDLIYLDYNCFQRGFDDPQQVRIQMEALACQEIFTRAEQDRIELIWSFMHEDETLLCPFPARKLEAMRLASLCKIKVGPQEGIYKLARTYNRKQHLSAKDAVHLACAIYAGSDYFLTCDDKLLKQAARLKFKTTVMNPVDFIRQGLV